MLSRLRGGGSSLPGLVVEKIYPDIITTFGSHFSKIILVSGTNGKTTTTKMLREILHSKFDNIVHNEAGSNMSRGVISAVISAMDWKGGLHADVGLFEVDEGFLPYISEHLCPDVLVVLNLHRDQLDRYGELERITHLVFEAASYARETVINIDDPRLHQLHKKIPRTTTVAASSSVRRLVPSDDELNYQKDTHEIDVHKGADIFIASAKKRNGNSQYAEILVDGKLVEVELRIPGVFNTYNAASALGAGFLLGVGTDEMSTALSNVEPAFGRTEQVQIDGKTLQILLVKNPSGFNQVIMNFLNSENFPVLVGINDNHADGRDVSWLWDVDIESWNATQRDIYTTGVRGHDMALRLQYADIPVKSTDTDIVRALDNFIQRIPSGETGYIVPTYTAMLTIRKALAKKTSIEAWK